MSTCIWCQEKCTEHFLFSYLFYRNPPQKLLCEHCTEQLNPVKNESAKCLGCEKRSNIHYCEDCLYWKKIYPNYVFKHRSLYYYNDFAREYMERFKIMGDCELSSVFADELRRSLRSRVKRSLIIPIPISQQSKEQRGFNQVELLLTRAGIPYTSGLKHIGQGEKQAKKNKTERMSGSQPFIVDADKISLIKGASLIIVDDLYTTGRTMFYAADALKQYDPQKIETFSLFR